ncbi:CPBP family intramembrane glutamic endopeptidase [Sphingomonas kaistensis]|uniref:CPBP family intramembrane glutamic endopeptidase n=1 Tax=Sphingomonas kaistensis TaxID=298708 RepID=A0ABZ2FYL6_9SPHN
MQNVAIVTLVVILGLIGWLSLKDARDYQEFKNAQDEDSRLAFYRRWTIYPMLLFGFGGAALLAWLGRTDALTGLPSEFAAAAARFSSAQEPAAAATSETMLGMALGMTLGLVVTFYIWRARLRAARRPIGDIEALLPRTRREVLAAIPLSINAGISEEIFFRAALPMLAFVATGSVPLSFAISIVSFGIAHWYQGFKGVLATTAMGALFAYLYLSSGSLLKPILIHILIDLVALAIRPAWSIRMNRKLVSSQKEVAL